MVADAAGEPVVTRRKLGLDDADLLLVHLGFLTPAKGMETLLRALLVLRELRVRARLLVVGEGSERGALAESLTTIGLADRVSIYSPFQPGQRDDFWRYLAASFR